MLNLSGVRFKQQIRNRHRACRLPSWQSQFTAGGINQVHHGVPGAQPGAGDLQYGTFGGTFTIDIQIAKGAVMFLQREQDQQRSIGTIFVDSIFTLRT